MPAANGRTNTARNNNRWLGSSTSAGTSRNVWLNNRLMRMVVPFLSTYADTMSALLGYHAIAMIVRQWSQASWLVHQTHPCDNATWEGRALTLLTHLPRSAWQPH